MSDTSRRDGQSASVFALILLFLVLFGAWLLWSGIYKPLVIGFGVFSCVLCVWLAARTDFFRYSGLVRAFPRLPSYWFWLSKEIIASSFAVARMIVRPDMPISPTVVEIDASELTDMGQVVLGNSITLSPGTVTIDLYKGRLKVHCISRDSAADLVSGEAQRRVQELGKS